MDITSFGGNALLGVSSFSPNGNININHSQFLMNPGSEWLAYAATVTNSAFTNFSKLVEKGNFVFVGLF